jgi:transposase InsO family protein
MPRSNWDAQRKAMIVLEGLRGKPGAQSCPAHEIRQSPYDQWRDQLVAHAAQAFQDGHLLPRLQQFKAEHPFWGDRRLWASRRFVEQMPVNKKRILRVMREHQLLVQPNLQLRAKRTPTGSKPRPTKPNEWWGSNMTKVLVQGVGWVSIVLVLDWYSKTIVGYSAGLQCTTQDWLRALDMAVNRQFPEGVRGQGVSLMRDNGCQPTSAAFMQACGLLGIHQAFTR